MLKPQSGKISLCSYCGEQVGNTAKYCTICRKKESRQFTAVIIIHCLFATLLALELL